MPLYEYQCEACDHRFEVIQKFSDPPVEVCPVCTGTVRKLLSSPAIQFKGSGWYITDYARKGSGDAAKGESRKEPTATTDAKGADTKPETKSSEAKSDTKGEAKSAG